MREFIGAHASRHKKCAFAGRTRARSSPGTKTMPSPSVRDEELLPEPEDCSDTGSSAADSVCGRRILLPSSFFHAESMVLLEWRTSSVAKEFWEPNIQDPENLNFGYCFAENFPALRRIVQAPGASHRKARVLRKTASAIEKQNLSVAYAAYLHSRTSTSKELVSTMLPTSKTTR